MELEQIKSKLNEAYRVATKEKHYDEALAICNALIEAHPSIPWGLRKRAAIYAYMGDFRRAIADITEVIEKGPECRDLFYRGWWHFETDAAAEAVADLTMTIDLEELDAAYHTESAYFFRALALLRLGRYEDALADCKHVREDFLIHLRSGRVSRDDIIKLATAGRSSD